MNPVLKKLGWAALSLAGASALGVVALKRGEPISAIWIVIAAVCVYLIAYRFYSKFIAEKVMGLDAKRMTPAYKFNDGLDHVPTNKNVLFGHHFAAIAGAGPLVGPTLAAQFGYLPGALWIIIGAVLGGAVQDENIALNFSRDEETGTIVVKLIDQTSGETVQQIPAEALLHLSAALGKLQGQLFDRRA